MKKYIFIILGIVFIPLGMVYFLLISKQASYHESISSSSSSVLILSNFQDTPVRIIVEDRDDIAIDIDGPGAKEIGEGLEKQGIFAEFGFSEDWRKLVGEIRVPKDIAIEIGLVGGKTVTVGDKSSLNGVETFIVDTSSLNSLSFDSSGNVILDGGDDLEVWNEAFQPHEGGGDSGAGDVDDAYCGVGGQSVRNLCCSNQNSGESFQCNGLGYWVFNNVSRQCDTACEVDDSEPQVDCGVGGQSERNICCTEQNQGAYQGCIGGWAYDNTAQSCQFACDSSGGGSGGGSGSSGDSGSGSGGDSGSGGSGGSGGGDTGPVYNDPTSQFCSGISGEVSQGLCCNDALKNSLSSGPKPGFPDCIGEYFFDGEDGCIFECAEHTRMIEIINEIRSNINQQQ